MFSAKIVGSSEKLTEIYQGSTTELSLLKVLLSPRFFNCSLFSGSCVQIMLVTLFFKKCFSEALRISFFSEEMF